MKCPYCHSPMKKADPLAFAMSWKARKIFDDILASGVHGLHDGKIMDKFFPRNSPVTMRTTISKINGAISPMRIKCKNHTYRIVPQ